jgi:hypothetical protein
MKIKSIKRIKKKTTVYDITVDIDHSFKVFGCVLHNCLVCGELDGKIFTSEHHGGLFPAQGDKSNVIQDGIDWKTMEERFGKDFVEMIKTGYDKMDKIASFDDLGEDVKEFFLKNNPELSPENLEKKYNDIMSDFKTKFNEGTLVRNQKASKLFDNIDDFIKDPRLKSQFETGVSEGLFAPEERRYAEDNIMRSIDKLRIPDNQRPVYGEVLPPGLPFNKSGANYYGEIKFILSDSAKERTTYTLHDSLVTRVESFKSEPFSGLNSRKNAYMSISNIEEFNNAEPRGGSYIESQTWGGVDLSKGDVSKVVVYREWLDSVPKRDRGKWDQFLELLKSYKIDIEVL